MKLSPARQFLVAFAGTTVAVSAAWLLPGAAGRGFTSLLGQAAPAPAAPVPAAAATSVSLAARLTGLLGIALIIGLAYALSHNRQRIRWRTVGWALALQLVFAIFVLREPFGTELFRKFGDAITAVLHYSYAGSAFVFG